MLKRHCLFCDQIVPVQEQGDYDRYLECYCSPEGSYSLLRESYEVINALGHGIKRQVFPLISAYIREETDKGEKVTLAFDDIDTLANSSAVPVTIEEKGYRFLQYLYRHSEQAGEPVVISLTNSYNLTYSPNLQELVYIIDKLQNEQSVIREGMTFKLTDKGWREAAERAGGRKLKSCYVLMSGDGEQVNEWNDRILPKLEQCGYLPRLYNQADIRTGEPFLLEQISECKLVIADLTGQLPAAYLAGGYALGLHIPVIWCVRSEDSTKLMVPSGDIRPLVWDNMEDLAATLQQRLIK
jgi:hypothetical protein